VLIDLNHYDTLRYEWLLAHCYHLVVCLVVLMDGLEDYRYNYDGYYYITLIMMLITLLMLALCMLLFIGANLIHGLIKMTKIMKAWIN
jgi:hypothetical protein